MKKSESETPAIASLEAELQKVDTQISAANSEPELAEKYARLKSETTAIAGTVDASGNNRNDGSLYRIRLEISNRTAGLKQFEQETAAASEHLERIRFSTARLQAAVRHDPSFTSLVAFMRTMRALQWRIDTASDKLTALKAEIARLKRIETEQVNILEPKRSELLSIAAKLERIREKKGAPTGWTNDESESEDEKLDTLYNGKRGLLVAPAV